ncbi:MAG: hypothetical protein PHG61_09865 [Candidatus Marinimicrobia bacterium]|nr:hypothetical protein [Candidatus Neomarinimicrobiota bacterium]
MTDEQRKEIAKRVLAFEGVWIDKGKFPCIPWTCWWTDIKEVKNE